MAFSGVRWVALQLYALAGRVPGPFQRHIPFIRSALFQLVVVRRSTFELVAVQSANFQLVLNADNTFGLGA